MQINRLPPHQKSLRGQCSFSETGKAGEQQNARKLLANYLFGFGVRRGDGFVSFGSGPPRSAGGSGGNLGLDDASSHVGLRRATSRRRPVSSSCYEPWYFWRSTAAWLLSNGRVPRCGILVCTARLFRGLPGEIRCSVNG